MSETRTPFVYWSQTESEVNLRVEVSNTNHPSGSTQGKTPLWTFRDPDMSIQNSSVDFNVDLVYSEDIIYKYNFSLEFPHTINPKKSSFRAIKYEENSPSKSSSARLTVEIRLEKEETGWWNKVTKTYQNKPHWLKVDFDRWKTPPSSSDEDEDNLRRRLLNKGSSSKFLKDDIMKDYPGLMESLKKEELGENYQSYLKKDNTISTTEKLRLTYLFIYNLFQFIGYLYIVGVLAVKCLREGREVTNKAYQLVGGPVKYMQILQILEVLHPMLGFTPGSFVFPAIQIFGRCIILFGIIGTEERIQPHPCVFFLFLTWSAAEIFRYPHYLLQIDFKNPRAVKKLKTGPQYTVTRIVSWIRYSAWIPLYPMGFACEAITIFLSIQFFEETRRFSIMMPNQWNFTFSFTAIMRIYLLFGVFPLLYTMMMHMLRARRKQKFRF